jgi:DNA-binding phage protein
MSALITREMLSAYLDDALAEADIAQIEQELRGSQPLRQQLATLMQERDRGEHSVGAIWRRQRLSCPAREQLGSYLLGVLDDDVQDYIQFHLQTIGCAYCMANLADMQTQQQDADGQVKKRRKRYYQSSAGLLQPPDKKKKS